MSSYSWYNIIPLTFFQLDFLQETYLDLQYSKSTSLRYLELPRECRFHLINETVETKPSLQRTHYTLRAHYAFWNIFQ